LLATVGLVSDYYLQNKMATTTVKKDRWINKSFIRPYAYPNLCYLLSFVLQTKMVFRRSSKYRLLQKIRKSRQVLKGLCGHMAEASSICTLLRKLSTLGSKLSSW